MPYQPETKADHLKQRLRSALLQGEFEPGQVISIRKIAQSYQTSVIPARDAMRGLVAEGALAFQDSRTIVVPQMTAERMQQIRFARLSLEPELVRRGFEHLDRTDQEQLRHIDAGLDRAVAANDTRAYAQGNYTFHFLIYRRAAAPVLLALAETLWLQYAPSMHRICTSFGAAAMACDYHRRALRALERGERDNFGAALAADIQQGMDFIIARLITGPENETPSQTEAVQHV